MSEFREYLNNSSPISRLQQGNKIPLRQLHNSVDLKMSLLKQNPKNYDMSRSSISQKCRIASSTSGCNSPSTNQYSQMKASSIIYNIPQLSPPQINFQISDHLRQKINQIKQDIVTKLPSIKSSQYNSNKVQSFMSRRTVLKDLQIWLQQKLKSPPLTYEDSIQYKNMIMGVGMKEVIRLIGTRCAEEANIVNQIWELTWSICREIILYLSKRAHKCQKILCQETSFFRTECENRIKQCQTSVAGIRKQNVELKQRSDKLSSNISSIKKKNKELKLIKLNLEANFEDLKQQFEIAFKQNLLLHLKLSPNDQARRQWVKIKYLTFLHSKGRNNAMFKKFLQNFLEENKHLFDKQEITQFDLLCDLNKFKQEQQQRKLQIQKQLQQRFRNFDKQIQTDQIEKQNKSVETHRIKVLEVQISTNMISCHEMGINTEQTGNIQKPKKDSQKLKKLNMLKKQPLKSKLKNKTLNIEEASKKNHELSFQKSREQSELQSTFRNPNKQTLKSGGEIDRNNSIQSNRISVYKSNKSIEEDEGKKSIKFVESGLSKRTNYLDNKNHHTVNYGVTRELKTDRSLSLHQEKYRINFKNSEKKIEGQLEQHCNQNSRQQEIIKQLKTQIKFHKKKIETLQTHLNNSILRKQKSVSIANDEYNIEKAETTHIEDTQILELIKKGKIQSLIKIMKDKSRILSHTEGDQSYQQKDKTYTTRTLSGKKAIKYIYNKKIIGSENDLKKISQRQIFDTEDDKVNEKSTQKNMEFSRKGSCKDTSFRYGTSKNLKSQAKINNLKDYNFNSICAKLLFQSIDYQGTKANSLAELQKKNLLRQQFRECLRASTEVKSLQKNQKHMRLIIDRSINSLFKELGKQMINAQKQGIERMQELKVGYNTLPIILTNRFNMNFGVKKVASKHMKDLLLCLKGIRKYTDKYTLIQYLLSQPQTPQKRSSQLLFFYILITSTKDSFLSQRSIDQQEIDYICEVAKIYLTTDEKFIKNISEFLKNQNNEINDDNDGNGFFFLCKKLFISYQELYQQRVLEMRHVFKALSTKNREGRDGLSWNYFVQFISPFYTLNKQDIENQDQFKSKWQLTVIKSMISVLNEEKISDNFISKQIFDKFLFKCPQFNCKAIQNWIHEGIILSKEQENIENKETQEKLLKICENNHFLEQIVQYLFESQSLKQRQMEFWLRYIKIYAIQQHTDEILGSLLTGSFDPKSSLIILESVKKQNK